MAWRGIHLSRSAYLCVKHRALHIEFKDEECPPFKQSLEDLAYLILDTPDIILTGRLLADLAESNTLVLGVNEKHLPVWTSLPWTRYYRQGQVLELQLKTSQPLKKQLWAHTVKLKIQAQARCLAHHQLRGENILNRITTRIRSGDPDNIEARAARLYWHYLFPKQHFLRHADDLPNICLNYAYAILRAAIARQLCAIGFITQLGIHHNSLSNAYNLADDLIEPYRPIADHFALLALQQLPDEQNFTTEHRRTIAMLLEAELNFNDDIFSTLPAIEVTCNSLKHAITHKDPARLVYPTYNPKKS